MQIISRCLKSPILSTIAFVLANIVWVISVLTFLGPQIGSMFASIRTHTPTAPLEKLECPFMLSRDGKGTVVATIANPYEVKHGYTVGFEVSAYRPESWQEGRNYEDRQGYYRQNVACAQHISIAPKQTAKASCVVSHPDIETDSINVWVYALSDHDTAGGIAWSYESSYKGFCLIQSGWMSISPSMIQAAMASVSVLLAIGWVFATWQYIEPINQVILTIAGFLALLAWGFIAWLLASISIYMLLLFLLVAGVSVAFVLWITRRMQKRQTSIAGHGLEQNKDSNNNE